MITHDEARNNVYKKSHLAKDDLISYINKQEKVSKLLELVLGEYDCVYVGETREYRDKHGDEIDKLREELK